MGDVDYGTYYQPRAIATSLTRPGAFAPIVSVAPVQRPTTQPIAVEPLRPQTPVRTAPAPAPATTAVPVVVPQIPPPLPSIPSPPVVTTPFEVGEGGGGGGDEQRVEKTSTSGLLLAGAIGFLIVGGAVAYAIHKHKPKRRRRRR